MKSLLYSSFFIGIIVLLFSCNESHNTASVKSEELVMAGLADGDVESNAYRFKAADNNGNSNSPSKHATELSRKLIRKADLKFETDSILKTHEVISDAAKNLGGFISNENQSNQTYRNTSTMTIRLPSDKFDQFIAICDGLGQDGYDRRNISANDVTEEFLDISARVKTKKELESRYHDLLKKAKNVEEVIQVEREIGKLRGEIESAEGRLNYLSDRVSMSTVDLEFYKEIERIKPVDNRPNRFVRAFLSGWKGLVSFLVGLVNIWPFLIFLGVSSVVVIRKIRKYRSVNK